MTMVYWSIEEMRRARELKVDLRRTAAAVARTLNKEFHKGGYVRTAKSVISRGFKGARPLTVSVRDLKTMEHLAAQGLTAAAIARHMGVTRNTIIGRCTREHISLGKERQKQPVQRPEEETGLPVPETQEGTHTASMCQYIDGGLERKGDWCMKPHLPHESYCQEHYDLCYPLGQRQGRPSYK